MTRVYHGERTATLRCARHVFARDRALASVLRTCAQGALPSWRFAAEERERCNMSELAHYIIPHDTLLEPGRVNRPPLRPWARELDDRLTAATERLVRGSVQPEVWIDIAGCMNNAALLEVFRGSPSDARALCELQLRWIEGTVRVHGLAAACDLAPQPWINIGRLLRSAGEHARSLEHFSLIADTLAGRDLRLGPISIDAATWQTVVRTKNLTPFLDAVYIIESWKTFMAARDYAAALEFLREASLVTRDDIAIMRAEVEVITLAKLGRLAEALAATDQAVWQQGDGFTKLVRVTYRLALMAASDHAEQARRLLEQLAERVLAANLGAARDQRALRYLHHLGLIATHLTLPGLAADIWRAGLAAARQLIDVPFELAFLESLLDLEGIEDRDALAGERATLLHDCLYATLLGPRKLAADPVAAADPVFATLHRGLEEAAERPWREAQGHDGAWDPAATAAVAMRS